MSRISFGLSNYLVLIVFGCLFLSGCQSTSFPKLAFWQKDSPILSARHDGQIEPPAAQLSPQRSKLFADSGSKSGLPPTQPPIPTGNKPNQARQSYAVTDPSGDEVKSDELAKAAAKLSQAPAGASRYSVAEDVKKNGLDLASKADQMVNSVAQQDISLDPNNTPSLDMHQKSGGSFGSGSARFNSGRVAEANSQTPKVEGILPPQKIANPYAGSTENGFANSNSNSGFNPSARGSNQTVSHDSSSNSQASYPSTPYREFAPQGTSANSAYSNGSLIPAETRSPAAQNQPLVPSPLAKLTQNLAGQSTGLQPSPSGNQSPAPVAALPASLLNTAGSYAPGSVKNGQTGGIPKTGNQQSGFQGTTPTLQLPANPSSVAPPASGSTHSNSQLQIKSGGSFRSN